MATVGELRVRVDVDRRSRHFFQVLHRHRSVFDPARHAKGLRAAMANLRVRGAQILAIGWEGGTLVVHWADRQGPVARFTNEATGHYANVSPVWRHGRASNQGGTK